MAFDPEMIRANRDHFAQRHIPGAQCVSIGELDAALPRLSHD
jgi:hypothetical protein